MDPFLGDPHVARAIYCVAIALIAALWVLAREIAERERDRESRRSGHR